MWLRTFKDKIFQFIVRPFLLLCIIIIIITDGSSAILRHYEFISIIRRGAHKKKKKPKTQYSFIWFEKSTTTAMYDRIKSNIIVTYKRRAI